MMHWYVPSPKDSAKGLQKTARNGFDVLVLEHWEQIGVGKGHFWFHKSFFGIQNRFSEHRLFYISYQF